MAVSELAYGSISTGVWLYICMTELEYGHISTDVWQYQYWCMALHDRMEYGGISTSVWLYLLHSSDHWVAKVGGLSAGIESEEMEEKREGGRQGSLGAAMALTQQTQCRQLDLRQEGGREGRRFG